MAKVPEVAHILSLYPQGVEIELSFALPTAVSKIRAGFQNCHIWAWNLATDKWSRCCTYTLSTPGGRHLAYFCSTGSGLRNTAWFSKLPYLGMKLSHWQKSSRNAHILYFYPRGTKLNLFSLYGQLFPSYFQNCHIWTWNLAIGKSSRIAHILSTPGGRNWAQFCFTGSGFQDTAQFSKLPYLGMKFTH